MKRIIISFLFVVSFLGMAGIAMAYSIRDDATGGDCTSIGIWDWASKTCTLTTDVYETIQIDSDYIILDGNGHTVTGTGTGFGVYLYGRTGVTIKNLNVENFNEGILLWNSRNNVLTGNTVLNNGNGIVLAQDSRNNIISNNAVSNGVLGIVLYGSSNNTLIDNTALNHFYYGILLANSSNNILTGNTVHENHFADLWVAVGSDSYCNNVIENTTGSGGRPIKFFNSAVNLQDEVLSELILCNADYSNINNVTIEGSETLKNNGLFVIRTDYSNIKNTNSLYTWGGITLDYSSNNILTGNTASNNRYGITLGNSSNNILTGNTASNNRYGVGYGILLLSNSSNNTLTGNTASANEEVGIYLSDSGSNTLTDNTASNNGYYGIVLRYSSNNTLTGNTACNNRLDFDCISWSILTESDNTCDKPDGCPISCIPCRKVDTISPTVRVTATPNTLWPPNHKMVDVLIDGSAWDGESGIATVVITVTDEYGVYNLTVPGFGSTIQLEAWREGIDKDGRVYTVTVVATDMAGNQSTATAQVIVPHDMRK